MKVEELNKLNQRLKEEAPKQVDKIFLFPNIALKLDAIAGVKIVGKSAVDAPGLKRKAEAKRVEVILQNGNVETVFVEKPDETIPAQTIYEELLSALWKDASYATQKKEEVLYALQELSNKLDN